MAGQLVAGLLGGGAADLGLGAGAEALRQVRAELDAAVGRLCISCCASVLATTKSTPCRLSAIMLSTALVPPPPTPITVMRGVKSV